jgi:hypothetical protein
MGAEDKGLSLEGLAHRLEAQTQRLEVLERENAELRSKVATLERLDTGRAVEEPASSSEKRRVSRSWLLRNAGAAAVGTMAAGALLARDASVAKANHFAPGISVDFVVTHLETADSTAVLGNAPNGEGVVGFGKTHGVRGEGRTGVFGKTSAYGFSGVTGQNTGSGYGVVGDGRDTRFAGVLGRNTLSGEGVRGEGRTGVVGRGSGRDFGGIEGLNFQGYGGIFQGGKAQLRIVPNDGPGPPTSGSFGQGDLYMDTNAALFVCVSSGPPWHAWHVEEVPNGRRLRAVTPSVGAGAAILAPALPLALMHERPRRRILRSSR